MLAARHEDGLPVPAGADQRRCGPAQGHHERDARRGPAHRRKRAGPRFHRASDRRLSRRSRDDIRRESWDRIVEQSGIDRDRIREAAQIAIESKRMICSWAMGITQHKNGVANVQTIVNFALLRGQIGRRGAGVCPVRGHSNVQGDRTVGIWEKMSPEFLIERWKGIQFFAPRKARPRYGPHDRGHAPGQSESLHRPRRQFPGRRARHALHGGSASSAAG